MLNILARPRRRRPLLMIALWVAPLALILPVRALASWLPVTISETGWVENLAFSPDGKTLAVDSYGTNGEGLHLRRVPGGQLLRSSEKGAFNYYGADDLLWTPQPELLVAASHRLIAWPDSGAKTLFDLSEIRELAASPDGRWIVASGQRSQKCEVVMWDVTRNRAQWRQVIDLNSVQTAFSSRYLCLGGEHLGASGFQSRAELRLFDAGSARLLRRFDAPLFHINDMAFHPTQPHLLALTDNSGLSVMDVERGQRVSFFPFQSARGALGTLAFSPDGSLLAAAESTSSGGSPSDILLFDFPLSNPKTLQLRHTRTLSGHSAWVTALAFSPDGHTLASGGFDKKLRLWRVR